MDDDDDILERFFAAIGQMNKERDPDRVFLKMVRPPYSGILRLGHLSKMSPEDFADGEAHGEIIRWFRRYPSKFIIFEGNDGRVKGIGVRVPGARFCLDYLGESGVEARQTCTDDTCVRFHVCRRYIGGHCKDGPRCPHSHHFQDAHNRRLLNQHNLDEFKDDELKTIFRNSQLRVCHDYNVQEGRCNYNDRCYGLHLCKKLVCGQCEDDDCPLKHSLMSQHSQMLLRIYDLVGRPKPEVLRQLLILRRAGPMELDGQKVFKNVLDTFDRMFAGRFQVTLTTKKKVDVESGTSATKSASVSLPVDAGAKVCLTERSKVLTKWHIELFDEWTSLEDADCTRTEEKYSDPNENSITVTLPEPYNYRVQIDFDKMKAELDLVAQDVAVRRDDVESTWLWYYQDEDKSWVPYCEVDQVTLSEDFADKKKRSIVGENGGYRVKFEDFTQKNRQTGIVRRIRRRPIYMEI